MEKENILKVEQELNNLRGQEEHLMEIIQDKDDAVGEYDRMIDESEKAYEKVNFVVWLKNSYWIIQKNC
jgi:SMC interacting uncharacterized protein involved in chromosome segregation